jgi:isoleucyl-tRNA synthetase
LEVQSLKGGFPVTAQSEATAIQCHRVINGGRDSKGNPTVVAGEGTGIVHTAPGCGDVDYRLGEKEQLVAIAPLGPDGCFDTAFGEFAGMNATAKETADLVIERLREKDLLVYVEPYPHIYPHCWRTGDELIFRLVDEWFIDMDWREEIKDVVRQITWLPESIDGQNREIEWLSHMGDWMISKKRYWGLALPIWIEEYEVDGRPQVDFEVLGSLAELRERAVEGWDEFQGQTPHRPWIDQVKIRNPKTGNLMSRIPDVGNPWLDAGIVPFSTMQYNTNRDAWASWYPVDLVVECFPGQFRNWFYALLAMATMMDNSRPFTHLIGHRLVMNEEGKAMHKSDGTAIWFEEAAEQLGVDTMRWLFLAQPPAVDLRFGTRFPDQPIQLQTADGPIDQTAEGVPTCKVVSKPADDVRRRVLIPLWNCYAFFVNYARLDEFDPTAPPTPVQQRPEIDRWILSRLQTFVGGCNQSFHDLNVAEVCRQAVEFLDELSNWYIRRNRRRFWRSRGDDDTDKLHAYQTLYHVLTELTKLLAPCIPFLTERIYQNLVRSFPDAAAPMSVHLCDYPQMDETIVDEGLNLRMATAQQIVALGHTLRDDAKLRVRQPLAELRFAFASDDAEADAKQAAVDDLADVIRGELNVKQLVAQASLQDMITYQFKPNLKSLGAKHGSLVGKIRGEIGNLQPNQQQLLRQGKSTSIAVGSEQIEILAEDVIVATDVTPGWVVREEFGVQVALSTTLTPELKREGAARDFVRHVQQLRKSADLQIEERIEVYHDCNDPEVLTALKEWHDYIRTETLADCIALAAPPADADVVRIGSTKLKVWIVPVAV